MMLSAAAAPPEGTSTIRLLPVSAMNISPFWSTATPCGEASVTLPIGITEPAPAVTFTMRLFTVSAM